MSNSSSSRSSNQASSSLTLLAQEEEGHAMKSESPTTLEAASPQPWAIRLEEIGKRYKLGGVKKPNNNLREDLMKVGNRLKFWQTSSRPKVQRGEFWALKDISLEIPVGQVMGILGANGAGKSTLLKVLSRITRPTTGTLRYRGRLASLLEVGTGFHRELTGRENIFLNGSLLGMRQAEIHQELDAIVEFAGVDKFLETPVKHYSSGMYVRLAFAVAAHLKTDILVVDEVLAVGDTHFQKKCLGKMREVAQDGRTVLFVSHNLSAIRQLCHQAILLEQGRLVKSGSVEACMQEYLPQRQTLEQNFSLNPGEPGLRRVRLCQEKRHLVVDLETQFLDASSNPFPELILHDSHGMPLLGTNPNVNPWQNGGDPESQHLRCRLDFSQFRSGEYRLSVHFATSQKGKIRHDQVLVFPWENELTPGHLRPSGQFGPCLPQASWERMPELDEEWTSDLKKKAI
ncbi:Teichoic acids export ATP-binding protein TagH [Planctomycetales bacterium 10988]|nr:Teichoic acids export ATP-binding protein TagH [Planctomycetales bacterium 10988]